MFILKFDFIVMCLLNIYTSFNWDETYLYPRHYENQLCLYILIRYMVWDSWNNTINDYVQRDVMEF
jgi:hypothetical protein